MDKFKIIYNAITDIGKIIFKYKNQKITAETEDSICEMMVMELQQKRMKNTQMKRTESYLMKWPVQYWISYFLRRKQQNES